jgi:penicillin-binding protein 1A
MKQAVGKYCGDFPKPKHSFVSQQFFGHYATTGGKGADGGADATGTTSPQGVQGGDQQNNGTGGQGNTGDPGGQKTPATNGGTTYDPGKYESPPHGTPGAGNPPGQ